MASTTKTVQFDHLAPYYLETSECGGTSENRYDMSSLFAHISGLPSTETKKKIFGETHYFHKCCYDETNGLWELQILHLREKVVPGIAYNDGTYELIQLEDGQYLAESTTIAYNPVNCVFYFQRNMYGTSINAFVQLLTHFAPYGTMIMLKPIMHFNRLDLVCKSPWFSKVILVADADQIPEGSEKSNLMDLLRSLKKYEGRTIKLELGVGRKRDRSLRPGEISALIKEAYEFAGTDKLEVRTKGAEDCALETIDLLDDRDKFIVKMAYSRENPITHERLYRECVRCVNKQ